jgi:hypothetical protein
MKGPKRLHDDIPDEHARNHRDESGPINKVTCYLAHQIKIPIFNHVCSDQPSTGSHETTPSGVTLINKLPISTSSVANVRCLFNVARWLPQYSGPLSTDHTMW